MIVLILHNASSTLSLSQYMVTVDEIELQTGIEFFPELNDQPILQKDLIHFRLQRFINEEFVIMPISLIAPLDSENLQHQVFPCRTFFQTVGFIPIFSKSSPPEIKYIEIKIQELGYNSGYNIGIQK